MAQSTTSGTARVFRFPTAAERDAFLFGIEWLANRDVGLHVTAGPIEERQDGQYLAGVMLERRDSTA
jgi:hypothetical protein